MCAKARRDDRHAPGFEDLLAALKAKRYASVYVLEGEDTHRMEQVVAHLRDTLLDEAARSFNYQVYAGDEADLRDVLRQALSYPMLAQTQLLWVRDAERCNMAEGREEALEKYLKAPSPQTVMVLTATKFDGRRRWVKLARESGEHFVFANPQGAELVRWTQRACAKAGLQLDETLAELLCERVGDDLRALSGEIAKLSLAAAEAGRPLTAEDVRTHVRQQREADVFELVYALKPDDPRPALRAWRRLAEDGHAAQELIPLLSWRVRQLALVAALIAEGSSDADIQRVAGLWPRALSQVKETLRGLGDAGIRRALAACKRCEGSLKGSPLRPDVALELAILEICGCGR